ncbi:hypothetical protein PYW08_013056 [Mythimna loreyi]|uniref:Uncharacterized protein n=1 Tax=Mythimna loreyi TaxID=667449 RepID=A0ACC2PZ54_9NEOP|nr:hypothetical protein PYW08_013056 [Mythimna loreyi]
MAFRMQRCPPSTPIIQMDQTRSEPDITQALNDPEFVNINSRNKRPRLNESPREQSQFERFKQEFKSEIKEMLMAWKTEQDANALKQTEAQRELITKLRTDMSELKLQNIQIQNTNSEIQETNIEIEKTVKFLSSQYDDLQKDIKRLQQDSIEYKKHSESLEMAIRDLQYKSRSSSIEVRNIPIQEKETSTDLSKIVTDIANIVNLPLTNSHFRVVYRVSGNRGATKPIVAEFKNVQTKLDLISRVRSYNNKRTNKEDKLNTEVLGILGQKQPVMLKNIYQIQARSFFTRQENLRALRDTHFAGPPMATFFFENKPEINKYS